MIKKITFFILSFFIFSPLFGQIQQYQFKQEIKGISNTWYQILLPPSVLKNLKGNHADIRLFGITDTDTIEAPYIFKESTQEQGLQNTSFKIINQSSNSRGYYYTFVLDELTSINQIALNFSQQNFDFNVKLEGSDNKRNWFTIIDDYQLIGIQNRFVDFSFTKLKFTESEYKYYRLQLKTDTDPYLVNASIKLQSFKAAEQDQFEVVNFKQTDDSKSKKTTLEFSLKEALPVSEIQLDVSNTTDYYRRYYLSYLADSTKTEKGYIKNYRNLQSGTMHSFEQEIIKFSTTIASEFKIEIENQDNMPLKINGASAKGNRFYLTARFDLPAQYFLTYGNDNASLPNYDLGYFKDKIPDEMTLLDLGKIEEIIQKETPKTDPLFANSAWMYGILAIIILLLGFASIKMLKGVKPSE